MTTETELKQLNRVWTPAVELARRMRNLVAGEDRIVAGLALGMLIKTLVANGLVFKDWTEATQALLDVDLTEKHDN